jgi:valyl-tRNA synthetase
MTQNNEFPKKYNPSEFEEKIYSYWEKNNKFKEQESKT